MTRDRRSAFRRVREVIGPEICPSVSRAQMSLIAAGEDEVALELGKVAATAHHLRHSLVAALMRLSDPSGPCPNCGEPWDAHLVKCHLGRLLRVDHRQSIANPETPHR